MKKAVIISALPLTSLEKQLAQKEMERIFSPDEEIVFSVDPSILGGLVFKTDEKILDLSVKEELRQMEGKLVL